MNHRDYIIIGKLIEEVQIAEDFIKDLTEKEFSEREMAKR